MGVTNEPVAIELEVCVGVANEIVGGVGIGHELEGWVEVASELVDGVGVASELVGWVGGAIEPVGWLGVASDPRCLVEAADPLHIQNNQLVSPIAKQPSVLKPSLIKCGKK